VEVMPGNLRMLKSQLQIWNTGNEQYGLIADNAPYRKHAKVFA